MILKKGARWLVLVLSKAIFFLFALSLLNISTISAQQQEFSFSETSAAEALIEVSSKFRIKIAFDAAEMKGIQINKHLSGSVPDEVLARLLEGSGYGFEKKYDTYLIIKEEHLSEKKTTSGKTVTGIVFDKESGERLPYATINLVNEGYFLSATVEGTFSFTMDDSTALRIQISYLGYKSIDQVIQSGSASSGTYYFGLTKNIRTIGTVHITGNRSGMVNFGNQAGHFVFNPGRFSDLPNFGETDVFSALQLLPGISSSENSSQLNIRGGSADQNLVMFDGYTLYNLDHFFGVFSAINPNVIKNIQVYRGGFDSRYGERVSGIVDITGKSGNQNKPIFYGGINLISANLTAEVPVTPKLTLIAAGRRAYSDLYSSFLADAILNSKLGEIRIQPGQNVNELEPEFYFSDYNLKATYTPDSRNNLSFSVYGAKDYLDNSNYSEQNQFDIDTKDISKWGNYGFGTSWKRQWNPRFFSDFQAGHSGYFNDYYNKTNLKNNRPPSGQPSRQFQDTIQVTNEKNDLIDYFISVRNSYMLNPTHYFEFGAGAKFNQFTYYKDADYADKNFNPSNAPVVYNNNGSSAMLYSLFFQDRIAPGRNLELKPGLRLNLYGNTGKVYIEPRFLANYQLTDGISLKMATGRYFQYLSKTITEENYGYNRNFWVLADGETHPVVSSNHFILGANYSGKTITLDVEGYYKTINGLQEYLFFTLGENPGQRIPPAGPNNNSLSRFITGKGQAYGIDFLLKYEKGDFTSWIAYSLSKSVRNFSEINNNKNIPAPFDQTHDFKWTNLYSYGKWNFSSLTLFYTGHPYIEKSTKDQYFNVTRTYSRLPDYFRIDLSANYNFTLKNVYLKPGVSIINALNTKNYYDVYTRRFNLPENVIFEKTMVSGQKLTMNFFLNFRF